MGSRIFHCPPWVVTQQAAELFAAVKAVTLAAYRKDKSFHLYIDNHAAIHSLLRGKARSLLIPQNRLLRRLNYVLLWSGIVAALHYVPSALNPADPLSRWWSFPRKTACLGHSELLGQAHLAQPPGAWWGLLSGLQRSM